jgi:hypothetical protein
MNSTQSDCDCPQDQLEQLQSDSEPGEFNEARVKQNNNSEVIAEAHGENPKLDCNELKNMLASILMVIHQSNKELQDKMETSHKGFRIETEKLIKRFDGENKNLDKRFSEKLESGIRSVSDKVDVVQKEIKSKLETTKKDVPELREKLERKLDQQNSQTNIVLDGLATKLIDARSEFNVKVKLVDDKDENLNKKFDRKLTEIDQEVSVIKGKIKESADIILRRPWEHVEQIQSQAQKDKASTETQVGKLDSQVVELRELVLSRCNDSVPRALSSASESVSVLSELHMNVRGTQIV